MDTNNKLAGNFSTEGFIEPLDFLINTLKSKNKKLAVIESCTGGQICTEITKVPGASDVFAGGIVAYSNESKSRILNVPPEMIKKHSAISAEVASEMAAQGRKLFHSDIAISTTGIAGPSGGTAETPIGKVHFGLAITGLTRDFEQDKYGQHSDLERYLFLYDWKVAVARPNKIIILTAEYKFKPADNRQAIQKKATDFAINSLIAVSKYLR